MRDLTEGIDHRRSWRGWSARSQDTPQGPQPPQTQKVPRRGPRPRAASMAQFIDAERKARRRRTVAIAAGAGLLAAAIVATAGSAHRVEQLELDGTLAAGPPSGGGRDEVTGLDAMQSAVEPSDNRADPVQIPAVVLSDVDDREDSRSQGSSGAIAGESARAGAKAGPAVGAGPDVAAREGATSSEVASSAAAGAGSTVATEGASASTGLNGAEPSTGPAAPANAAAEGTAGDAPGAGPETPAGPAVARPGRPGRPEDHPIAAAGRETAAGERPVLPGAPGRAVLAARLGPTQEPRLEPARPPLPRDVAAGRLWLRTDPPVQVYEGKARLGMTPLMVRLEPGGHDLRLVDRGMHLEVQHHVEIREGQTLSQELWLGVGRLRVAAPDGAKLTLDGRPMGVAPFEAPMRLGEGRHRLRLEFEEEVLDEWIDIPPGSTVDYRARM